MTRNEIIDKALEILEPFEQREYQNIDDVHWVEDSEGNSDWGDFCAGCIDDAVIDSRKSYLLEQRKKPINQRDNEFLKFEPHFNHGGGYEDDSFNFCDNCGKRLDVSVLPGDDDIDAALQELKEGRVIDDYFGYQCYWLLYNNWGNDNTGNDDYKNKMWPKTNELANRVILQLTNSGESL